MLPLLRNTFLPEFSTYNSLRLAEFDSFDLGHSRSMDKLLSANWKKLKIEISIWFRERSEAGNFPSVCDSLVDRANARPVITRQRFIIGKSRYWSTLTSALETRAYLQYALAVTGMFLFSGKFSPIHSVPCTWYVRSRHNYCTAGHQSGVSISETRGYIPSEFRGTNAWQPILTIAGEQTDEFHAIKMKRRCCLFQTFPFRFTVPPAKRDKWLERKRREKN